MEEDFRFCHFPRPLHSFHISFTASEKEDCVTRCKTPNPHRLSAQLLSQLVEQSVQIFIVLPSLFNFFD
jgi:hypothetical protein